MAKIGFDNKVTLNPQPTIARENKVIDDDMNEIKSVVNTNDDNVINMGSYSTSEVNTGKTWIDGKTIYRKVLSFTTSSSLNTFIYVPHGISNVDTFLPNFSMAIKYNNNWNKVPNDLIIEIYAGASNFVYYNKSQYYAGMPALVILEYTKTS